MMFDFLFFSEQTQLTLILGLDSLDLIPMLEASKISSPSIGVEL